MCPLNDYCSCHEDDEAERQSEWQSDTACCPRQTIPDSCSCLEGCECMCLDCTCEGWGEEDDEPRAYGDLWVTGPSLVELDAGCELESGS